MNTKSLIQQQIKEMDRHKWIESEKAGCDLGQQAMLDWAENFMDDFFDQMPNSEDSKSIKTSKAKKPQAK